MTTKPAAKTEKKALTTDEKIAELIKLMKENGWSLPKHLED